jgi:nucleoside 2-deoxyribosyltransferase
VQKTHFTQRDQIVKDMYYFATPHTKTGVRQNEIDRDKLDRNEKLAELLEANGLEIFLPYRDADQSLPGKELLNKELETIRNCEGIITILSDTRGIYLETGYAKALGKKVIGLKVGETREMSEWGHAFFDYVASDIYELIKYIKNLSV